MKQENYAEDIIQIVAITKPVFAVHGHVDDKKRTIETKTPIFLAGLQRNCEVILLDCDSGGLFGDPRDDSNFVRFDFGV